MLELRALTKRFGATLAVDDVSVTIGADEYVTLLGPSGSGKSTLLRMIAGLERIDAGAVLLNGADIGVLPAHRRGLGLVQQNYALFPHMTVEENVGFGLRWREADPVTDAAELARRVGAMLELTGLTGLGGRAVGQLSGGQKQRVSLARTLVAEPRICLLDEPLGALDANLRERMTLELRRIRAALGVTFLHVTGNEAEALGMGDRMIVLDQGRAIMIAPPADVHDRPATVRVARFLNAYNILAGEMRDGSFLHAGHRLPAPQGAAGAAHLAVRYDALSISEPDDARAILRCDFIAAEFTGSGVVYFLRGPAGVIEVERHLSRADPVEYQRGRPLGLVWEPETALAFGADGNLLSAPGLRGAA